MAKVYFVTHPQVVIDPSIAVPEWKLSPTGRHRMRQALQQPWLAGVQAIICSAERKARDAAEILAEHLKLSYTVIDDLGENDRSATGYLQKTEFEAVADKFFANPQESVRGWERAADAQQRIVAAINRILTPVPPSEDIAVISHGGVGALLLCHLKGVPIDRNQDQPGNGGGNYYAFDAVTQRLCSGWQPIDT